MKSHCRGFTLLELLIVLSIIAIISGIGLAVMSHSSRQFAFQSNCGEIISMIRQTRSNAVIEKGSAAIVVNPNAKQIYACTNRTQGLWHFEDIKGTESFGAFGNNAKLQGDASIAPYGRYGNGLLITTTGYAQCGSFPVVSQDQGLSVDCWILPTQNQFPSQRTIINMTNAGINVDSDDSIKISYGSINTDTIPNILPYGHWSHIAMLFEPDYALAGGAGTLSLYINDVLIITASGGAGILPGSWNVNVGGPANPFSGMIDEVKISSIIEGDRLNLGAEVTIDADDGTGFIALNQPLAVWFNKDGNTKQAAPAIRFNNASARNSVTVEINTWGGVRIR